MVNRILKTLVSPVRGLHQAAYLLAFLTLASQALALIRDRLFASHFGAGEILDLYYAAFKVPDVVFALVASLVSAYVLIPLIAKADQEESKRLLSHAASFLVIAGGLICIVLAIFAPTFLFALFPTFRHSVHAGDFVLLARLLLVQPILLGLSGILTSVTQIHRRFALFALSPVLYNLGIIFGTVVLYPYVGLPGIGVGVLLGAFLHLAIHIPVVSQAGLLPRPTLPSPSIIWSVMKSSVPRSLALGMSSVITLLLISLASRTSEGGVAVYTLAGNLEAVPLSLVGASYATAAFPVMAEHMGAKRVKEYTATLVAAARHIIFWSAVITVLAIVLRAYVVRIILGAGAFDWDDTRLTAAVLAILVVGLMAQGLILLAARAFYAAQKSWNPLLVQLADCGISVVSAWGLVRLAETYPMLRYFIESLFRVGDVPGTNILFIALGATLGQVIMGTVALATLRTVAPGVAGSLIRPALEAAGAAILGGAASYGVLSFMGTLAPLSRLPTVFLEGTVAGMVGLAVAAAVLAVLENQELKDLGDALTRLTSSKALRPHGALLDDRADT
ncbi:MAG: murein biosynthesis integral membrane protein MurJ [Bacillota bacterium]